MLLIWLETTLTPSQCVCGKAFNVEHALSCLCGAFPSIWQNEIRDIFSHLPCVGTKPTLQTLAGENCSIYVLYVDDGARADKTRGFWDCKQQDAFLMLGSLIPTLFLITNSLWHLPIGNTSRRKEESMTKEWGKWYMTASHAPLVLSTAGGSGPAATTVLKRIANMLSIRYNQPYSVTMNRLRCRKGFFLLRSAIVCAYVDLDPLILNLLYH